MMTKGNFYLCLFQRGAVLGYHSGNIDVEGYIRKKHTDINELVGVYTVQDKVCDSVDEQIVTTKRYFNKKYKSVLYRGVTYYIIPSKDQLASDFVSTFQGEVHLFIHEINQQGRYIVLDECYINNKHRSCNIQ